MNNMIKFYGAEMDGYYLIMISNEIPKIGKTYIGWKPEYLSERIEFGSLMELTRKIIPWWFFFRFYRFGRLNRVGIVTITSTLKTRKPDSKIETASCRPLIDWLNENVRILEKDLKGLQNLNHPEHWYSATYIQNYD